MTYTTMEDTCSLSEKLKRHTHKDHLETENSILMRKVFEERFSISNYIKLLQSFEFFYSEIEKEIEAYTSVQRHYFHYFYKHPLILQDLQSFGAAPVAPLETSDRSLILNRTEAFLGALYVIEGSTLGGKLIKKRLENHIDVERGARSFDPYGSKTRQKWLQTRQYINGFGKDPALDHAGTCNFASLVFQKLQGILNA